MMMSIGKAAESAIRASIWDTKKPIADSPRISVCAC